jgi:hypothetical protein
MFNGPDEGILIEEAHTNLLTADVSQALTTESPYTTGTLDGTYTFSCMTGSYELSGGATGTVTPTSPQTKTITSATVTLTGTATFNQCTKTGYPLSWTLGGTTMAAETLTAPSSVLNIDTSGGTPNNGAGTIEFEAYLSHIPTSEKTAFGFRGGPSGNQSREYVSVTSTQFQHVTCSNSACTFLTLSKVPVLGLNKITARFGENSVSELDVNGVNASASGANLMNQNSSTHLFFGSEYNGGFHLNCIIRNIVISKTKRTDPDIANRSGRDGFGVDKEVTLIAPLKNNLNAYRVATV